MPDVELLELQTQELVLEFGAGAFPEVMVAILPAVPPDEITTVPWANVTGKPVLEYLHTQNAPSDEWIVNHNFGRKPSVEVRDTGGVVMFGQVLHYTDNQARVYLAVPSAGTARCV